MYGNSAGAQYVLRYLALTDAPDIDLAIASNSGVYMVPDLTSAYPIGMGGLDLKESHVRRYLGRRLILLIGRDDTDTTAPDLPRSAQVGARPMVHRVLATRASAWCTIRLEDGSR
jgi:hypothetical protein